MSNLKDEYEKIIIVDPEDRVTSNILQIAEAAQVLGLLATHIDKSGLSFINTANHDNAVSIAYETLYKRKCFFKIRRYVGRSKDGTRIFEEWDPNEMILPKM